MGRRKKGQLFLYANVKNKMAAGDFPVRNEKEVQINRKLVVTVTSLKHGAGSSYMSIAMANFLSEITHEKVCLLYKGCAYIDSVLNNEVDGILYPCDMGDVYSKYGFIIYDGGVINEADKSMIDRSDLKLMMCWPNEEYKRLLAEFIKDRKDIKSWAFLFNMVPAKRQKDIYDLMEDFNTFCMPVFEANLDKQIKQIFKDIFEEVL